jgi:hypothetical protein
MTVALGACGHPRTVVTRAAGKVATTSTIPCAATPRDQGGCGLTFEEQRSLNLRYAERMHFTGDANQADAVAAEVRRAVTSLASEKPNPTVADVRAALSRWADVAVTDNAVKTAGVAFGISVGGGCVFGSITDGRVAVDVGGYIRDGGCLAEYGH